MYKSNMAENPEKQTAWKCRLDQYPPNDTKPKKTDRNTGTPKKKNLNQNQYRFNCI